MRTISKMVVITGVGNNRDDIIKFSKERGFEYPMPHFFIQSIPNADPVVTKMRPIGARCAVLRDAVVADTGVGFIISGSGTEIKDDEAKAIMRIAKSVVDDLCLSSVTFMSDEINEDRRVDISGLVLNAIPDMFQKIR